ncbi:MAG: RusA family crossover junction endodeoxyribonuclease [Anaerovoracaceae bacterium]
MDSNRSVSFTVPGKPKGKTRPRFAKGGKNTYTDRGTKEYEKKVADAFLEAGGSMGNFAAMRIKAYYLIPQRTRKDILEGMRQERIRPAKKPDLDNVLKIVMDALTGVAIADDNQIVQVYIEKVYGEEPRLEITLYEPREECSLY